MVDKDYITVYWSPAAFTESQYHWNFLYQEPVSALSELSKKRNKNVKQMFSCPAYVNSMKNVYVFNNVFAETVELNDFFFTEKPFYPYRHDSVSKIALTEIRESSLENYINATYNLSWLLFADEPVEARFTAPYFPSVTPAPGVMLSTGQFNIGLWYRDYTLDYHIPFGTKELKFEEDQPLFYVEFRTDKKIIFKRYRMTDELKNIAGECVNSPSNYSSAKPLAYRYNIFKKTATPERVLTYIKENLVE